MQSQLQKAGWQTEVQIVNDGHLIQNVIARRGTSRPWIVLGAHYDSRFWADNDPDPNKHRLPVPGANDGASGVAVLLELARVLPAQLEKEIWLVFFDAEDNGGIPGWDWILGSRAFVETLKSKPDAAIVIDMIGDADLNIYLENYSNGNLRAEIWAQAASLDFKQFISMPKYSMLDDHTPFLEAGIPAVDIIDFDYPYWHTTADTVDKVSVESLHAVGETLLAWLKR
jgi:Zn-dependent M28 family amino/carboxypeptidase